MKCPSEDIGDLKNLLVRVITIGYQKKGESIIIILKNTANDSIIYSIVIDSFYRHGQHRTIELLKENHVKNLDMICWTHPDADHSAGIDMILQNFGNEQTKVVAPISFWSDDYAITALRANQREIEFVNKITKINQKTKCSFITIGVPTQGGYSSVYNKTIYAGLDSIAFSIEVLSPFADRLKGQIDSYIADPQNVSPPTRNQTSVTLLVTVGPYKLLFGADLPNEEIELMNEDRISKLIFLKIPHHCSESSKKMLDYIGPNSGIMACTTVYRSTKPGSELPHPHILSNYVKRCRVVGSTGSHPSHNFGAITADFDFFGNHDCEITLEGSAEIIEPQFNA